MLVENVSSRSYLVLCLGDEPLAGVVVGLSISATLVLDLVAGEVGAVLD